MQEAKHSPKLVISLKGYLSLCASLSHSHPIYHQHQHVLSTAQTDHSKAYPSHSKAITKGLNNFSLCSTCKVKNKILQNFRIKLKSANLNCPRVISKSEKCKLSKSSTRNNSPSNRYLITLTIRLFTIR